MRVWVLTVGEPVPVLDGKAPRLLRSGVLVKALAGEGHEVVWWTSAFDHYAKRHRRAQGGEIEWKGANVRLIPGPGYQKNVSVRRILDHRAVAGGFRTLAQGQPRPDVVLASLPTVELAEAGVDYALSVGARAYVDIRDLWPDLLETSLPKWARPAGRHLLAPMYRQARRALSRATGLVGISDEYLNWGLKAAGRERRPSDAMIPLGYAAAETDGESEADAGRRLESAGVDPSKRIVLYVGSFGRLYDFDAVLRGARQLQRQGRDDVQFVIAGDGELGPRWRGMAKGLGNVVFTGWIDGPAINWLRSRAAIGLQPYSSDATQGLANKLFEYLSAGVPVLSSLDGENRSLVAAHDCGGYYTPGNVEEFVEGIGQMLSDPNELRAKGERGATLYHSAFAQEVTTGALLRHLTAG